MKIIKRGNVFRRLGYDWLKRHELDLWIVACMIMVIAVFHVFKLIIESI